VPALVLVRRHVGGDLKSGERGSSRTTRHLHHGLVVAEVALACALLVSAALLVRTVSRMAEVPLGVSPGQVTLATVQIAAADSGAAAWQTVGTQHAAILDRLREQPGIRSAGSTNFLPLEHGWRNPLAVEGMSPGRPEDQPQAQYHSVSEGYFETMGVRLVEGRLFTPHDSPDAEAVVIVNETLARRFFPGQSAVGRQLMSTPSQVGPLGRNLTWQFRPDGHRTPPRSTRIVGVVADVRNAGLGLPAEPAVYASTRQFPFGSVTIAIASADTTTAVRGLRAALAGVSPNTPVGTIETWSQRADRVTAEPRLLMTTLTAFGGLAAFLAALGVYGLFSWSVAMQRRELAIRLTLGAQPVSVGARVVRRSVLLAGVGVAAGLGLVWTGSGVLSSVLFATTPDDPVSIVVGALLLAAAALLASLPPAWRAMRVDPVEGLRAE
jgi:putative ABC transport system permease protein